MFTMVWEFPALLRTVNRTSLSPELMKAVLSRREVQGMRQMWPMSVMGLMTVFRVLPDDLYDMVMESNDEIEQGAVFEEIVRRFGDPNNYHPGMKMHSMSNG